MLTPACSRDTIRVHVLLHLMYGQGIVDEDGDSDEVAHGRARLACLQLACFSVSRVAYSIASLGDLALLYRTDPIKI